MQGRRVELSPEHPLHRIASLAFDAVTGEVEVALVNGRVGRANIGPQREIGIIVRTVFHTRESMLVMHGANDEVFTVEVGRVTDRIDRPVVYLDQNHWIDLARTLTSAPKLDAATRQACEGLIELAQAARIIVPLSAGHVVETAKKGGRQRLDLARVLVELSRGWQMRSPLAIRSRELDRMFQAHPNVALPVHEVFTLTPDAMWADRLYAPRKPSEATDLPAELQGLQDRITWIASVADVLLEATPEVSEAGLAVAAQWASSFHELATHMRANPKARPFVRDLTRTRLISDIAQDLAIAAKLSNVSPNEFEHWLHERAEETISSLPALARVREVLHLRLVNADDQWEGNDLNDLFYLCSAAGYADVVIGEKKTCSYLRRVERNVPAGAAVFHRMADALPTVQALAAIAINLSSST